MSVIKVAVSHCCCRTTIQCYCDVLVDCFIVSITQGKMTVNTVKFQVPIGMIRSMKQLRLASVESSKHKQQPMEKHVCWSLCDMSTRQWLNNTFWMTRLLTNADIYCTSGVLQVKWPLTANSNEFHKLLKWLHKLPFVFALSTDAVEWRPVHASNPILSAAWCRLFITLVTCGYHTMQLTGSIIPNAKTCTITISYSMAQTVSTCRIHNIGQMFFLTKLMA